MSEHLAEKEQLCAGCKQARKSLRPEVFAAERERHCERPNACVIDWDNPTRHDGGGLTYAHTPANRCGWDLCGDLSHRPRGASEGGEGRMPAGYFE